MSAPNDGGPAFPQTISFNPNRAEALTPGEWGLAGISVRDYFAGQSLVGQMASYANQDNIASVEQMVKWNYTIADAMIAERSKPTQ